jgi:hypothetical protein
VDSRLGMSDLVSLSKFLFTRKLFPKEGNHVLDSIALFVFACPRVIISSRLYTGACILAQAAPDVLNRESAGGGDDVKNQIGTHFIQILFCTYVYTVHKIMRS